MPIQLRLVNMHIRFQSFRRKAGDILLLKDLDQGRYNDWYVQRTNENRAADERRIPSRPEGVPPLTTTPKATVI